MPRKTTTRHAIPGPGAQITWQFTHYSYLLQSKATSSKWPPLPLRTRSRPAPRLWTHGRAAVATAAAYQRADTCACSAFTRVPTSRIHTYTWTSARAIAVAVIFTRGLAVELEGVRALALSWQNDPSVHSLRLRLLLDLACLLHVASTEGTSALLKDLALGGWPKVW